MSWADSACCLAVLIAQVFNPGGVGAICDMVDKDEEAFESLVFVHTCIQANGIQAAPGLSPGQLSELAQGGDALLVEKLPKVEHAQFARVVLVQDDAFAVKHGKTSPKSELVTQARSSSMWNLVQVKVEGIRDATEKLGEYLRVWTPE